MPAASMENIVVSRRRFNQNHLRYDSIIRYLLQRTGFFPGSSLKLNIGLKEKS